mmetsp:Transcript_1638/g.4126  ORF Transcript_1638/g.4126 Transcript_1638/m.4126 type:complete len:234 (-) Transcript_1638:183-884(-)
MRVLLAGGVKLRAPPPAVRHTSRPGAPPMCAYSYYYIYWLCVMPRVQLNFLTTPFFPCSATPKSSKFGMPFLLVGTRQPYSCESRTGARYFSPGFKPSVKHASPRLCNLCERISRAASRLSTPSTSFKTILMPFASHGLTGATGFVSHDSDDIILRAFCSLTAAATPSSLSSATRTDLTDHLPWPYAYLATLWEKPRGGGGSRPVRKPQLSCQVAATSTSFFICCLQISASCT